MIRKDESLLLGFVLDHLTVCVTSEPLILLFNHEICRVDRLHEVVCRAVLRELILIAEVVLFVRHPVWHFTL